MFFCSIEKSDFCPHDNHELCAIHTRILHIPISLNARNFVVVSFFLENNNKMKEVQKRKQIIFHQPKKEKRKSLMRSLRSSKKRKKCEKKLQIFQNAHSSRTKIIHKSYVCAVLCCKCSWLRFLNLRMLCERFFYILFLLFIFHFYWMLYAEEDYKEILLFSFVLRVLPRVLFLFYFIIIEMLRCIISFRITENRQ